MTPDGSQCTGGKRTVWSTPPTTSANQLENQIRNAAELFSENERPTAKQNTKNGGRFALGSDMARACPSRCQQKRSKKSEFLRPDNDKVGLLVAVIAAA